MNYIDPKYSLWYWKSNMGLSFEIFPIAMELFLPKPTFTNLFGRSLPWNIEIGINRAFKALSVIFASFAPENKQCWGFPCFIAKVLFDNNVSHQHMIWSNYMKHACYLITLKSGINLKLLNQIRCIWSDDYT